jgi:hypothetical protein
VDQDPVVPAHVPGAGRPTAGHMSAPA